jgi:hypothetical protein
VKILGKEWLRHGTPGILDGGRFIEGVFAMRFVLPIIIVALFRPVVQAADSPAGDKQPTKIWNRQGPLGETPKPITDAYPLSDQENKGGWVKFEPMTDEFDGKELDRNKWVLGIAGWKGRQPAPFP